MDIQALRTALKAEVESAELIAADAKKDDGRDMTADEQTTFDAHMDTADDLRAQIKTADEAQARTNRLALHSDYVNTPLPAKAAPDNTPRQMGENPRISIPSTMPWQRHVGKSLMSFENSEAGRFGAFKTAKFLQAISGKNPGAVRWCENNGVQIGAALGEGVPSEGGFLVPTEFSNALIALRDMFGVARRLCRVMPMGSDVLQVPRQTAFATISYPSEANAATEGGPVFAQTTLTAKKAMATVLFSSELAEDSLISMADLLTQDIGIGLAEAEDDAWINGDGTNTYGGIVGLRPLMASAAGKQGTLDATSGDDTAAEILKADLFSFMRLIPEYALAGGNARFLGSSGAWGRFLELAEGSGGSSMMDVAGGIGRQYLGYPFEVSPKMPSATTTSNDSPMVFFGDFNRGCLFGDRRSMRIAVLSELYAASDQLAVIATTRFDIQSAHGVGSTTVAGPIVSLNGTT